MAFSFFSSLDTTTAFLLVIIFVLFIFSFKKVLGLAKNALIIVAASVIFPIVANALLGLAIPMDTETIISFIFLGLFIYFLYFAASVVYKGLSAAEKKIGPRLPEIRHEKGGKKEKNLPKFESSKKEAGKPFIIKGKRKEKEWEKDYVNISDKPAYEYKEKKAGKEKKAKMEKIRVIGEDEGSE